jgi:hypothetical protein
MSSSASSPIVLSIDMSLLHALSTFTITVHETPQDIAPMVSTTTPCPSVSRNARTIAFQQHDDMTCARSLLLQFDQEANMEQDALLLFPDEQPL